MVLVQFPLILTSVAIVKRATRKNYFFVFENIKVTIESWRHIHLYAKICTFTSSSGKKREPWKFRFANICLSLNGGHVQTETARSGIYVQQRSFEKITPNKKKNSWSQLSYLCSSHIKQKKPEKFDLMNKWFNDLMNNEYLEYW